MGGSGGKVLSRGLGIPSQEKNVEFPRNLDYSTQLNFRFSPDGAGKLAEMKVEAPGAGFFSGLGMLTGIDVDGGSTLHEEIRRDWLGNLPSALAPRQAKV